MAEKKTTKKKETKKPVKEEAKPKPAEKKPEAKKETKTAAKKEEKPKKEEKEDKSAVEKAKVMAAKKAGLPEKKKEKEAPKILKEMIQTVSLRDAYNKPQVKRAREAIKIIRKHLRKHTRKEKLVITDKLNRKIWSNSVSKPPRKVKIKIQVEEERAVADLV